MTEVLKEGKNFRLLAEEELPQVLQELGKYLPESIKFHETLKTYINDRVWDFHFYVCKNWPEEVVILHFPGMTKTPNATLYESFSVFCPTDQLDNLSLLFGEDELVDWSRALYLNFTHVNIVRRIEEHYTGGGVGGAEGGIGTMDKLCGDVYSMKDDCCESNGHHDENGGEEVEDDEDGEKITFPDGAVVLTLTARHAAPIYALYPARELECIDVFQRLLTKLPSFGVFSSPSSSSAGTGDEEEEGGGGGGGEQEGELIAWMVQSYYGAMFSMQTRPEYRRRGYGAQLARSLTRAVRGRGYRPFVVIRPENEASLALYMKLGFRKEFETVRAVLRPKCDATMGTTMLDDEATMVDGETTIETTMVDDDATIELTMVDGETTIAEGEEETMVDDDVAVTTVVVDGGGGDVTGGLADVVSKLVIVDGVTRLMRADDGVTTEVEVVGDEETITSSVTSTSIGNTENTDDTGGGGGDGDVV